MIFDTIEGASIRRIVAACPTEVFENTSYAETFGEKYVKKNIKMTGVERFRKTCRLQTASELCYIAAERLLEDIGWDRDEIGALVFVSQFPDFQSPSTAFVLQSRLGLGQSCFVFDINLGCSGFTAGLQVVSMLLQGSDKTKGLLLCGDTCTKTVNPENQASALMFGDAGTATAIELDGKGKLVCAQGSKGSGYRSLYKPQSGYRYFSSVPEWREEVAKEDRIVGIAESVMQGDEVFQFTMTDVVEAFKEYFGRTGTTPGSYDYFVLHQAQKLIVDNLAVFCDIPLDKLLSSYKDFGNTSVASIPLTLCWNKDAFSDGQPKNVFMSGFGIGLSYGVVSAAIDSSVLGDIVYSDDYYKEWR